MKRTLMPCAVLALALTICACEKEGTCVDRKTDVATGAVILDRCTERLPKSSCMSGTFAAGNDCASRGYTKVCPNETREQQMFNRYKTDWDCSKSGPPSP